MAMSHGCDSGPDHFRRYPTVSILTVYSQLKASCVVQLVDGDGIKMSIATLEHGSIVYVRGVAGLTFLILTSSL